MIRTSFTPSLPIPLLIAMTGNLVAILVNQEMYGKIRGDLRQAVWNRAFADTEALVLDGHRDDLAARRHIRQVVEAEIAACSIQPDVATAMPRLCIADASNSANRAVGEK